MVRVLIELAGGAQIVGHFVVLANSSDNSIIGPQYCGQIYKPQNGQRALKGRKQRASSVVYSRHLLSLSCLITLPPLSSYILFNSIALTTILCREFVNHDDRVGLAHSNKWQAACNSMSLDSSNNKHSREGKRVVRNNNKKELANVNKLVAYWEHINAKANNRNKSTNENLNEKERVMRRKRD